MSDHWSYIYNIYHLDIYVIYMIVLLFNMSLLLYGKSTFIIITTHIYYNFYYYYHHCLQP